MKLSSNPFLAASLGIFAALLPVTAFAVTKANNTNTLNLPASWTGGVAPDGTTTTSAGVAQFDTSIIGTGAASYTLGGNVTWGMLRVDRATATAGSLITIAGANTITLNGNNSVAPARQDAILLNSATGSPLQIDSNIILGATNATTEYFTASRGLTLNGSVDLSGVNLNAFTAAGTSTYNGALFNSEDTSNLVKSGGGILVLTNANTYNGTTTIENGTLSLTGSITSAGNVILGSSSNATFSVGNGGTLTTTGTLSLGSGNTGNVFTVNSGGTVNAGIVNNPWGTDVTVNGTLNVTTSYTVSTNATKFIAGSGTINAASFSLGNAATTVNFTHTGTMNLTGLMTFTAGNSPTFNQSAGTVNTAGLALHGTTSTYTLTGGRINIGTSGIAGTGTTRNINLGAGTVGARADWSSALAMSLTNAATGTTFDTLDSVDNTTARAITLSGALSGTGQLVKTGTGTLTLTGPNTYNGSTLVKGGKLMIGTGGSLGNTALTVGGSSAANSPTFGGVGTIVGATLISAANGGAAGRHAPGISTVNAGVGKQTFSNNLEYGAGSIFEWDLNGNTTGNRGIVGGFDAVDGGGILTVDTGTIFKIVLGNGVDLGNDFWDTPNITHTWTDIFSGFSSLVGGFNTSNIQITGQSVSGIGSFTISGTSLTWTAVPEPTSALAGLLLGAGLLRRRRRA